MAASRSAAPPPASRSRAARRTSSRRDRGVKDVVRINEATFQACPAETRRGDVRVRVSPPGFETAAILRDGRVAPSMGGETGRNPVPPGAGVARQPNGESDGIEEACIKKTYYEKMSQAARTARLERVGAHVGRRSGTRGRRVQVRVRSHLQRPRTRRVYPCGREHRLYYTSQEYSPRQESGKTPILRRGSRLSG